MRALWLVIIIFVILTLIVAVIFTLWYFYKRSSINCRDSGWVWSENCTHFEEKFFDKTLKDPTNLQLYLVGFSQVDGAGPPVCLPMWYCFRYVNVKTGGYSPFSQWTSSPVRAGGFNLPCLHGECNTKVLQGKKSCDSNQPILGVPDLQYDPIEMIDNTFVYANIHRYVGKPNDILPFGPPNTTNTEIIGYLIPNKTTKGIKYAWRDVLFNPCRNNPPGCGRCTGC